MPPAGERDRVVSQRFAVSFAYQQRPSPFGAGTSVPKANAKGTAGDYRRMLTGRQFSSPPHPIPFMSDEKSTARREFLGQFAASAIVLAGAGCASPGTTATQSAPAPAGPAAKAPSSGGGGTGPLPQPPATWDDSWFGKLTAKHKAVFDSPEILDGLVLTHAAGYVRGMREAIAAGENDVQTVIVLRHLAVVLLLNDAMWSKYDLGKLRNVKDPDERWATKNPFAGAVTARSAAGTADRPQATLNWFASRGHCILGCDLATRNLSGTLARQTKGESSAVYEELKANMIAGVILQPTGVYACLRAQEAGCAFFKST